MNAAWSQQGRPTAAAGTAGESVLPPAVVPPQPATVSEETWPSNEIPVGVALNFRRVLVAGYPSTLEVQLENRSPAPVEELKVTLESRGLKGPAPHRFGRLGPGQRKRGLIEVDPETAGNFVLRCAVALRVGPKKLGFVGTRSFNINAPPDHGAISVNLGDIQINSGSGSNAALGAEYGDVKISDLLGRSIKTLNDLLDLELQENFQPLELAEDYELSVAADELAHVTKGGLVIPQPLLGKAQRGSRLKLVPLPAAATSATELHFIARAEFRIGRARPEVDFLAWFWPRSAENDERTRQLSKLHVLGGLQAGQPALRDAGSSRGSSFDEHPLGRETWEPLVRRGTLKLGADYQLDVMPTPAAMNGSPAIRNLSQWPGPKPKPAGARGAVRFKPINSGLAGPDAIWLLTDAAFGSSRTNAAVLELPGIAEIQGRVHHYCDCFWLENIAANEVVHLNEYGLKPGEIAPLADGQQLRIGPARFSVQVSD
jgi:hypothetical protein